MSARPRYSLWVGQDVHTSWRLPRSHRVLHGLPGRTGLLRLNTGDPGMRRSGSPRSASTFAPLDAVLAVSRGHRSARLREVGWLPSWTSTLPRSDPLPVARKPRETVARSCDRPGQLDGIVVEDDDSVAGFLPRGFTPLQRLGKEAGGGARSPGIRSRDSTPATLTPSSFSRPRRLAPLLAPHDCSWVHSCGS